MNEGDNPPEADADVLESAAWLITNEVPDDHIALATDGVDPNDPVVIAVRAIMDSRRTNGGATDGTPSANAMDPPPASTGPGNGGIVEEVEATGARRTSSNNSYSYSNSIGSLSHQILFTHCHRGDDIFIARGPDGRAMQVGTNPNNVGDETAGGGFTSPNVEDYQVGGRFHERLIELRVRTKNHGTGTVVSISASGKTVRIQFDGDDAPHPTSFRASSIAEVLPPTNQD